MSLRSDSVRPLHGAAILLALSAALPAQLPGGLGNLGSQPAVVAPPRSPAEKLEDLKREIERLKGELQFVQQRTALGVAPIKDRLQNRVFAPRAIDVGTSATAAAPAPTAPNRPQPARRMTSEEQQKFQGDVLMLVQGKAIRAADFQRLVDYLGTVKDAGDLSARDQRVALELIRLEAVLGTFEDSAVEARQQIDAAKKELDEGKPWAEAQNRYGRGPNMAQEGRVQINRYSPFGLEVEMAAFTTEKGKIVGPIRGATGYCILAIDGVTKSDTDAGDTVDARLIFMPYHGDPGEMDKIRAQAITGQIDLVVRDDAAMLKLPPSLRPTMPQMPAGKKDVEMTTDGADAPVKKEEAKK